MYRTLLVEADRSYRHKTRHPKLQSLNCSSLQAVGDQGEEEAGSADAARDPRPAAPGTAGSVSSDTMVVSPSSARARGNSTSEALRKVQQELRELRDKAHAQQQVGLGFRV